MEQASETAGMCRRKARRAQPQPAPVVRQGTRKQLELTGSPPTGLLKFSRVQENLPADFRASKILVEDVEQYGVPGLRREALEHPTGRPEQPLLTML